MNRRRRLRPALVAAALLLLPAGGALGQSILESWGSVSLPPAPKTEPVTLEAARTALIVLDLTVNSCNPQVRPSCVRSLPQVRRLLTEARARKLLVIHGANPPGAERRAAPEGVEARTGEPVVRSNADKFYKTDLEAILKRRGIQSVIVVGGSAQGAVLYTASGVSLRGMKVILPIDAISAEAPFSELYAAWHLKNGAGAISRNVTLTRSAEISFR